MVNVVNVIRSTLDSAVIKDDTQSTYANDEEVAISTDAGKAAEAGISAILASNHGGRQLDNARPTINVLPEVVSALRHQLPKVEVYMDSGVRNGWDIFKALSRGAKAVFIGRPALWDLAIGGEQGVRKMLTILRSEFNKSMIVAGYVNLREIYQESGGRPIFPLPPLPPIFPQSASAQIEDSSNEENLGLLGFLKG